MPERRQRSRSPDRKRSRSRSSDRYHHRHRRSHSPIRDHRRRSVKHDEYSSFQGGRGERELERRCSFDISRREHDRGREHHHVHRRRSYSRSRSPVGDHGARALEHFVEPRAPLSDAIPEVGSIHEGTVHTIKPFGVFVQLKGYRRHALVHHSQLSNDIRFDKSDEDMDKVKAMEFFFPKGQAVWVKVTEVSPGNQPGDVRINGSLKMVSQQDGADLDLTGRMMAAAGTGPLSEEPPEVNSVHRATVKRIEPYGVFVQLQGYRKHGLVHSSQVSNFLSFSREDPDEQKKAEIAGVVAIGDQVYVKVVEVIDDESGRGPKIGCSIKLVDQSSGEDLDPNGLRWKPRGAGDGVPRGPGSLGAHAGEVVGGKIDWGHLKGDMKLYVGDHAGDYALLEDEGQAQRTSRRGGGAGPGPAAAGHPLTPAGRGRDSVRPSWMTSAPGAAAVEGMLLPELPVPGPPQTISSVEEALAILEKLGHKAGKKSKAKHKKDKDKRSKKEKKEKKEKNSKKGARKARKAAGSDSASSCSSDSG